MEVNYYSKKGGEDMIQAWTADVVARMHMAKIQKKQLAREAGYTPEYLGMILGGKRDTKKAKANILIALERLEGQADQK